ncbi:hypothetical protein ElyMa_006019100 [Elysia marginata]|uniref:Uncharacterized protein n=1 Tax=Elysia marginata TaxID=1093978 RepID=A0AAV4GJ55_9GAST|nr:hypothetical protein ElyMa_006019100 [Elysia marginata]
MAEFDRKMAEHFPGYQPRDADRDNNLGRFGHVVNPRWHFDPEEDDLRSGLPERISPGRFDDLHDRHPYGYNPRFYDDRDRDDYMSYRPSDRDFDFDFDERSLRDKIRRREMLDARRRSRFDQFRPEDALRPYSQDYLILRSPYADLNALDEDSSPTNNTVDATADDAPWMDRRAKILADLQRRRQELGLPEHDYRGGNPYGFQTDSGYGMGRRLFNKR